MADSAGAIRAEWRAEEAAWSRAALEHWEHGRDLADVLRDCMQRGDGVTFAFPSVAWSGAVIAVGRDIARIDTGEVVVDVRVASDGPFVLHVRPGRGVSQRTHAALTTFTARVRELDGTSVTIGIPSGALEGMMRRGRDQLRLVDRDGNTSYVPAGAVCWVRPLDDD